MNKPFTAAWSEPSLSWNLPPGPHGLKLGSHLESLNLRFPNPPALVSLGGSPAACPPPDPGDPRCFSPELFNAPSAPDYKTRSCLVRDDLSTEENLFLQLLQMWLSSLRCGLTWLQIHLSLLKTVQYSSTHNEEMCVTVLICRNHWTDSSKLRLTWEHIWSSSHPRGHFFDCFHFYNTKISIKPLEVRQPKHCWPLNDCVEKKSRAFY